MGLSLIPLVGLLWSTLYVFRTDSELSLYRLAPSLHRFPAHGELDRGPGAKRVLTVSRADAAVGHSETDS